MRKSFIRSGSFFAMFAVIFGAFGAHTLEQVLDAEQLSTFETAVRYQFYHSFALLFLGLWLYFRKTKMMEYAGLAFIIGIVLFQVLFMYYPSKIGLIFKSTGWGL